jgi:hypothetical protein
VGPKARADPYSLYCLEAEECELRLIGFLGS